MYILIIRLNKHLKQNTVNAAGRKAMKLVLILFPEKELQSYLVTCPFLYCIVPQYGMNSLINDG